MVQVCNGAKTKAEMIDESVEQYKHVFVLARNNFNRIVEVLRLVVGLVFGHLVDILLFRPSGNTCLMPGPSRGTSKEASTYQTTTTTTMPEAVGAAAEGEEEEGEGPEEEEEGVQVPQEVVEVEQPDGKHVSRFGLSTSSASLKIVALSFFSSP